MKDRSLRRIPEESSANNGDFRVFCSRVGSIAYAGWVADVRDVIAKLSGVSRKGRRLLKIPAASYQLMNMA